MNSKKLVKSLEKIVKNFPLEELKDKLVRYDENGGYCLYETYVTHDTGTGFLLEKLGTHTQKEFSSIRYAVAWAIMDKRNLWQDANRLLELDRQLADAMYSIKLYEKYSKSTPDKESKCIYLDKLINNLAKRRRILTDLEDIVERANRWQIKRFEQTYNK